ncbi:LVIVD repeat-containing protein [Pyxidicoccus sp. MSG2]|uniref:LVIVD repeat-containing protein n=1 Tax=Pyxidicoccus sp. MSG2 TaxID=2996790 RepID=UPI0022705BA1|nr:hypothetical protein [Pyxidicoccus sp. MSG2]MCY1018434.1 hypothetical protein [Pyxidicoccus sp. MSG2]
MPSLLRSPWALPCIGALCLFALSGCTDSPDPDPVKDAGTSDSGTHEDAGSDAGTPEDAGSEDAGSEDSGTADAGPEEPWDGGYTVLAETGDWVDRGPYAPCAFNAVGAPDTVSCEDLSRYDVSQCSPEALAAVPPHGIYMADLRMERRLADGGTRISPAAARFVLRSDGGPDMMSSAPLLQRQTDGGTFFVAGRNPYTGLVTALAGCQVPLPGIITGCFSRCVDGLFAGAGTFEAHNVAVHPGEPESSGGLELLSESFVALGMPADVYVAKHHAYVVSFNHAGVDGGLTVFDVSDPRHPIFKASISLPGDSYWNGVWAKGDALYIASLNSGVLVYDITNPGAPEFVRSFAAGPEGVHTVLVDGNRLHAMSLDSSTLVFDVTNPLSPVLLQSISLPEELSSAGPHDAFAYEGRLYVSNGFGGLSVMDVTDLENVRHLGQFVHGGGAYAHHSEVGTFAGRTIAFEGGEASGAHLRVLDVTDPAHIVKMGEFRLRPVTSIHNFLLRGTRLYVAWYQEGLRVLDVSNPTKPRQVAHYNTFRETDPGRTDNLTEGAFGIRVPGDGAVYLVDSSRGLLIFNEP